VSPAFLVRLLVAHVIVDWRHGEGNRTHVRAHPNRAEDFALALAAAGFAVLYVYNADGHAWTVVVEGAAS
jgi:hypothetical protein